MKRLLVLLIAAVAGSALTVLIGAAAEPKASRPEGFTIGQIRFDEGVSDAIPSIPRDWQLVTVAAGTKAGENSLWFRDVAGNIYVVYGFYDTGRFVLKSNHLEELPAK